MDEATHTLTHHVLGSNTRDRLVGKDLARIYTLTDDGRLIIRSANPRGTLVGHLAALLNVEHDRHLASAAANLRNRPPRIWRAQATEHEFFA